MEPLNLPKFTVEHGLSTFLADLRAWSFGSQAKAARVLGLAHTTISRYESGQIVPPIEYLCVLGHLMVGRDWRTPVRLHQQSALLDELNHAIMHCYAGQAPFSTWKAVDDLASGFLGRQRRAAATHRSKVQSAGQPLRDTTLATSPGFYGRAAELDTLNRFIETEQCQLIGIFGLGGIGKSALVRHFVSQHKSQFDVVFWASLCTRPRPEELAASLLQQIGWSDSAVLPQRLDNLIEQILVALHSCRVLIVLDQFESVLEPRVTAGRYCEGYEGYEQLLHTFSALTHRGCVLITSRERPVSFTNQEPDSGRIRSLRLGGMRPGDAYLLLADQCIRADTATADLLIARYSGNPLAIKIIAEQIRELFADNVAAFMSAGELVVSGIEELLEKQFWRLSEAEQRVFVWLAIKRTPLSLAALQLQLHDSLSRREVSVALVSLWRRSLVEHERNGFMLQKIVQEYISSLVEA